MNLNESVIYQIYPLGLCGGLSGGNDAKNILVLEDWVEHFKRIGVNAIYFSPVFESDRHGYDTRDYMLIDKRLGTNEDFKKLCKTLKDENINVILDGVFNHVGRGFWAFKDVLEKKESSQYKDWFLINFHGNSNYNDGFYYEGWEGHFELVKLNLKNPAVVDYLLSCVKMWIDEFLIDGLRLDVCYSLDKEFLKRLRHFTTEIKNDFVLIGELLHGDYNQFVNNDMVQSCTNYECYKGLYSSLNEKNMFEISYSLNRQFGSEQWTLYKGKNLVSFLDNHDVSRIQTILKDKNHLPIAYTLLFTMPGIPCVYYGSEWGIEGDKKNSDDALRPALAKPEFNDLTKIISTLSKIHKSNKALLYGSYKNIAITNHQLAFLREFEGERVLVSVNLDDFDVKLNLKMGEINGLDLISNENIVIKDEIQLKPYECSIIKII